MSQMGTSHVTRKNGSRCCVLFCGVVLCGVVWCCVVWCGVVWCVDVEACHSGG